MMDPILSATDLFLTKPHIRQRGRWPGRSSDHVTLKPVRKTGKNLRWPWL